MIKPKTRKSLLTAADRKRLTRNGILSYADGEGEGLDHEPVVKLFCPWGRGTWLLTELDPEDDDIAYGLCDIGLGCVEYGSVSISELESITRFELWIERDREFRAAGTLSAYAEVARKTNSLMGAWLASSGSRPRGRPRSKVRAECAS